METRILIPSVFALIEKNRLNKSGESSSHSSIINSSSSSSCDNGDETETEIAGSSSSSCGGEGALGMAVVGARRRKQRQQKSQRRDRIESVSVKLTAKERIPKGTTFGPNDGEIRIHHFNDVPNIFAHDVSITYK
jgi:hypothetical protein